VKDLEISSCLQNRLTCLGIQLLHQVLVKPELELASHEALDRKSLNELKDFLAEHSLSLGMNPEVVEKLIS
jgi:DNA-directed RNA polymerase alpha subunit